MSDTYSTYLNQNLELNHRLRLFFSHVNVGSAQWTIEMKVFAHHNKKSRGQNCYHMVKKPGCKTITLDSSIKNRTNFEDQFLHGTKVYKKQNGI